MPVCAVRLCPVPSATYRALWGYKEAPTAEARCYYSARVRQLFGELVASHAGCVRAALGGVPDLVAVVPSTQRLGPPPLESVLGPSGATCAAWPLMTWAPDALRRGTGTAGHMRPDARAFAVAESWRAALRGARVLLLDDVYVTGARAQSAAAALRAGGARAVVVAPAGRVVRPDRNAAHAAWLAGCGDAGHPARCLSSN
jgi:hypothetical protein